MKSRKRKNGMPRILTILILILFVGVCVKGLGYIINNSSKKQTVTINNTTTNGIKKTYYYSLSGTLKPIGSLSECQIIAQRNLFEPLGGWKFESAPKTDLVIQKEVKAMPPQPRPEPLNDLILTGIVYINNEYLALIEDGASGKSYFLKKGDKMKDYSVEKITEEEITLVNENSKIVQVIGTRTHYNTNGKLLASGSGDTKTYSNVANEPKANPAPSSNNKNMSLIEQMKARRQKELGQ